MFEDKEKRLVASGVRSTSSREKNSNLPHKFIRKEYNYEKRRPKNKKKKKKRAVTSTNGFFM